MWILSRTILAQKILEESRPCRDRRIPNLSGPNKLSIEMDTADTETVYSGESRRSERNVPPM